MLEIEDLHVSIEEKKILNSFNLRISPGEIHAFMGPNGAGKSTLARVLAGHPAYQIVGGSIKFEQAELLALEPEERAQKGIFMSFQSPIEIAGVTNFQFLHAAYQTRKETIQEEEFDKILTQKMKQLSIPLSFKTRCLNEGFSGGERKKNEILQMNLLEPKLAFLDEIDSGLDIDALKWIAEKIQENFTENKALCLITHYARILNYIKPHFVHVIIDGTIVESGDYSLALKVENTGYHAH